MTLVVARSEKGRIAIVADTMVSENGKPLPMRDWMLKSICLPGGICVSYSNSPHHAGKDFQLFRRTYPSGADYRAVVEFFERSSASTNNDYIIAFARTGKLVTIRDGCRASGLSKTHWIGDKEAYEKFRRYEFDRRQYEHGRAVNAALFGDEMEGSPASNLYSTMRNVVYDRSVPSVGGFVTVLSNRDIGFRFSVYSDVLLDWPQELDQSNLLRPSHKFDLRASGENDRYSISQISSGYYDMNTVAFYVLKGRLLVVFYEVKEGGSTACVSFNNIHPDQIAATLDERFGFSFRAMCLVMSARQGMQSSPQRSASTHGLAMSLFCEVNTLAPQPAATQS